MLYADCVLELKPFLSYRGTLSNRVGTSVLLSEGRFPWSACGSDLGQDTEPRNCSRCAGRHLATRHQCMNVCMNYIGGSFSFHKYLRCNPQSLTEVRLLPLTPSPSMRNFWNTVTTNRYQWTPNTSWRNFFGSWTFDTSIPFSLHRDASFSIASRSFDPLTQTQCHKVFAY